jgi:glycerate 2-kinase
VKDRQILKNRASLISRGDRQARRPVLSVLNATLEALDSYRIIKSNLTLTGEIMTFGSSRWDLSQMRHIYVVGGGKAANAMARAIEAVLAERISAGVVAVKNLEPGDTLQRIELTPAGHPLPNADSARAGQRMLQLVEGATCDDLFIGLISGGSSALMASPLPGISLDDEIACTKELLASGARILEINAVRRHISAVNGGRLAQAVDEKGARMINFIVSDGVGNAPLTDPLAPARFFGTPVAPDKTTFADARSVLAKYSLRAKIPPSIVEFIDQAGTSLETPKTFSDHIQQFVIQKVADAGTAAVQAAESLGLNATILTTFLQGESREAGTFLACVAKEIAAYHRPLTPPCLLIAGGETTTTIDGRSGLGGPSQELALGFALEIAGQAGICLTAVDTDGTDGPTQAAGGIVDGMTVERARQSGIDIFRHLQLHESLKVFEALGDEIITGNTGTNVCDLNLVSIL